MRWNSVVSNRIIKIIISSSNFEHNRQRAREHGSIPTNQPTSWTLNMNGRQASSSWRSVCLLNLRSYTVLLITKTYASWVVTSMQSRKNEDLAEYKLVLWFIESDYYYCCGVHHNRQQTDSVRLLLLLLLLTFIWLVFIFTKWKIQHWFGSTSWQWQHAFALTLQRRRVHIIWVWRTLMIHHVLLKLI